MTIESTDLNFEVLEELGGEIFRPDAPTTPILGRDDLSAGDEVSCMVPAGAICARVESISITASDATAIARAGKGTLICLAYLPRLAGHHAWVAVGSGNLAAIQKLDFALERRRPLAPIAYGHPIVRGKRATNTRHCEPLYCPGCGAEIGPNHGAACSFNEMTSEESAWIYCNVSGQPRAECRCEFCREKASS